MSRLPSWWSAASAGIPGAVHPAGTAGADAGGGEVARGGKFGERRVAASAMMH
jgi:hypothetical protein